MFSEVSSCMCGAPRPKKEKKINIDHIKQSDVNSDADVKSEKLEKSEEEQSSGLEPVWACDPSFLACTVCVCRNGERCLLCDDSFRAGACACKRRILQCCDDCHFKGWIKLDQRELQDVHSNTWIHPFFLGDVVCCSYRLCKWCKAMFSSDDIISKMAHEGHPQPESVTCFLPPHAEVSKFASLYARIKVPWFCATCNNHEPLELSFCSSVGHERPKLLGLDGLEWFPLDPVAFPPGPTWKPACHKQATPIAHFCYSCEALLQKGESCSCGLSVQSVKVDLYYLWNPIMIKTKTKTMTETLTNIAIQKSLDEQREAKQETKDDVIRESAMQTCICGKSHKMTMFYHKREKRHAAFFTTRKIHPWMCSTCHVLRLTKNCKDCDEHRLQWRKCKCGIKKTLSHNTCKCHLGHQDVYPCSLDLVDALKDMKPDEEREAATVCWKCLTILSDDKSKSCSCSDSGLQFTLFYWWIPTEDNVWRHENENEIEEFERALQMSLNEQKKLNSGDSKKMFSYAEKKRDWSSSFYQERHGQELLPEDERLPWWCVLCDRLNPRTSVPKSLGWGASRFICVHSDGQNKECGAERPGFWTCPNKCGCSDVLPYDTEEYNCTQPGTEKPPPVHKCNYCPFHTRHIDIFYTDHVQVSPWTERYLVHTRTRKKDWLEHKLQELQDQKYIDVDRHRVEQEKLFLRTYLDDFQTALQRIEPKALTLHPDDIFDIFWESERLSPVSLWLFLHAKVPMSRFTDDGTFQSLWPRWIRAMKASDGDDALRVLCVAVLNILPFPCWWIIASLLMVDDVFDYNQWKSTQLHPSHTEKWDEEVIRMFLRLVKERRNSNS
jgi:hypothetical protein